MSFERVAVGDVLKLQRRPVSIEPDLEYTLIGVYSFGKGIFHRDPTPGASLGDYRFFRVEAGDLVLSNIQAWEGAIAHAGECDSGTIGTHRFLTYVPSGDRIDTNWARWFFLSEPGFALIQKAAPGTVTRNRTLSIERFEALEIPLPPIEEQRRVAAHLDQADGRATRARVCAAGTESVVEALLDALTWKVFQDGIQKGWAQSPLGEVTEVNPRPMGVPLDGTVTFVPMAAVDEHRGVIAAPQDRSAGEVSKGYKQFRPGDVLFARITPCMQNGKCAVFRGPEAVGYGSTEFHVIRPGDTVSSEWIHRFLRTRHVRLAAVERFTGTAGQQRVPVSFMEGLTVPVPPPREQERAIAALDRIDEVRRKLSSNRQRAKEILAALRPSLLNQAFSGLGQQSTEAQSRLVTTM